MPGRGFLAWVGHHDSKAEYGEAASFPGPWSRARRVAGSPRNPKSERLSQICGSWLRRSGILCTDRSGMCRVIDWENETTNQENPRGRAACRQRCAFNTHFIPHPTVWARPKATPNARFRRIAAPVVQATARTPGVPRSAGPSMISSLATWIKRPESVLNPLTTRATSANPSAHGDQ